MKLTILLSKINEKIITDYVHYYTQECYESKRFSRDNLLYVYKLLIYVSTCIKKTATQWCLSSNFRNLFSYIEITAHYGWNTSAICIGYNGFLFPHEYLSKGRGLSSVPHLHPNEKRKLIKLCICTIYRSSEMVCFQYYLCWNIFWLKLLLLKLRMKTVDFTFT